MFKNNKNQIFIEDELINSYLSYAMSVIIGRALPDVRDGLKPVHRRTLYVMKELNNKFNKNYKKSARIVGDVIGKYHPHGETAIYDSIVRLTQTFVQRYPLIDGQGNFGSIDGDNAAAMRYTEIKMSEITEYMLKDLDFDTVNYNFNYDNTEKYPTVFPSMFPNILLNGSYGIAVGMATNIPPHNITEIINACIAYINNPLIKINELTNYILGPDFPTYGSIHNIENIKDIYITGKGKISIKAKSIIKHEKTNESIIITELPYQVNKIKLLIKIKNLIKEKIIEGIKFIRDESDKDGLRIFIAIEKNKNTKNILQKIYSYTNLKTIFNINMLCLVQNIPKLLDIKKIINFFIEHRQEIIYRRINHIIIKIKNKIHLLKALYNTLFNTTDIINLLNKINNITDLKKNINLININNKKINNLKFLGFFKTKKNISYSNLQIQSILDLKLSKLIKIEKNFIINSYIIFIKDYFFYKNILQNKNIINKIIKNELLFIKKKFSDKRKTKIFITTSKKYTAVIEKEKKIILLSKNNYIDIKDPKNYKIQHRGGKGKNISTYMKFNDTVINTALLYNSDNIICLSEYGKIYSMSLKKINLLNNSSRGISLKKIFNIDENDNITLIKSINLNTTKKKYIAIITKSGILKIILIKYIKKIKNNGLKIIKLNKNDKLVDIQFINKKNEIMIFSNLGRTIRFNIKKIKITSRQAKGVNSIKLKKNDYIISSLLPKNNSFILTATENGYSKCSKINDYRLTHRGGKGIKTHKINNKTGNIIAVEQFYKNNYLFIITTNGIISKIKIKELPCLKRNSIGVLLLRLHNKEKIINIKKNIGERYETMHNNKGIT